MVENAPSMFYGRYATPNTKQVEATVANLEGAEAGLAVASGMAAVSLVLLSFLKAGDHIVAQRTLYPTTFKLIYEKLPTFGIETSFVDQTNLNEFKEALQPNTKLIYVESPANPTLSLTDLKGVAELAKNERLISVADNTFATPVNQRPISHGIDLVVHSATKYLAGHSDVVAGVVIGRKELIDRMWRNHVMFGGVLHPMEAWLLERGLKTIGIRVAGHNENALAVARYLDNHRKVRDVYYPGLPNHPQHDLARAQMPGGFGGMVCFDLLGGREAGYQLLKHVRTISLAVSLGGVHSLITHPASTISRVQTDDQIAASGVKPGLARLSVGLEAIDDILSDLEMALKAI
jgi:methionine-gamma-lyase